MDIRRYHKPRNPAHTMLAPRRAVQRSQGFTLVELLVVMAIIAMLVALLVPAINGARESGRQTTCRNNLDQMAKAILGSATSKGSFPGYQGDLSITPVNLGSTKTTVSWQVLLLPNMGRGDLYNAIRTGIISPIWSSGATAAPYLEWSNCPSNFRGNVTQPWTSYIVNEGRKDAGVNTTPADWAANGVFHDLSSPGTLNGKYKTTVTLDYLHRGDGATNTSMVSESIDVQYWWNTTAALTSYRWYPGSVAPNAACQINNSRGTTPTTEYMVRPSSNHPGGVNMAFCDGRTKFIKEDIDYTIYSALMTPNGRKIQEPGSNTATTPPEIVLVDGSF